MPNHITNKIEFYGDQENINKVLELIKGEKECIDFEKIIPMPKTLHLTSGGYQNAAMQYAFNKKTYREKTEIKKALQDRSVMFYGNYYGSMFSHNYSVVELQDYANEFEEQLKSGKKDVFDHVDYEGLGIKTFEDLGNAYINNIINYGYDTWYDWCCAKWGTKWNAYDALFDKGNNIIEFDTAWSCPIPVLNKLADICYSYSVSFEGKWADEDCGSNVGVFESDCNGDEYWFNSQYVENCSNEAYEIYVELKGENNCLGKDEDGNWVHYNCDNCPNADNC